MSMCILALRCTHIYKQSRCQTKYLTKAFIMSGLLVFGFCVECDNREFLCSECDGSATNAFIRIAFL